MACQKALEREKIAKGIKSSKEEELKLREMQQMQMEEKRLIEEQRREVDRMWHDVLLDNVRRKEHNEQLEAARRRTDMRARRREYDAQVAAAARERDGAIRAERDRENTRLEAVRRRMEADQAEELKRKKEQQQRNTQNFIEGHEQKLRRVQQEKRSNREIDNETIREALEQLRKERQRERAEMQRLQQEKQVFIQNYNRERRTACSMNSESDRVADEWHKLEHDRADDYFRSLERERARSREQASEKYRRHLEEQKAALERERHERTERMARVRETATSELRRQLSDANEELRRQFEYRSDLDLQREQNLQMMEAHNEFVEQKQRPFTKKQQMFKDVMETRVEKSPGRISTNPVHPFKRLLEFKHETNLPSLHK